MAAPEQEASALHGRADRPGIAGAASARGAAAGELEERWGRGETGPSDEEISGVFRAYAARDIAAHLEPRDTSEAELRGLIRRFVDERRARGEAPERVLIALKRLMVSASHRLTAERHLDRGFSRYLAHVVRWTVEDHVAGWVVTDYFDEGVDD